MSTSGDIVRQTHRAARARRRQWMAKGRYERAREVRVTGTPAKYYRELDWSRIRWLLKNGKIEDRHEIEDFLRALTKEEAENIAAQYGIDLKYCACGKILCACYYPAAFINCSRRHGVEGRVYSAVIEGPSP